MALTTNVAGFWSSTANVDAGGVVALGLTEDGWDLSWRHSIRYLEKTDKFGDTPIEGFYRGLAGGMSLSAIFHEWKATELAMQTIINDTIPAAGATVFNHGIVGSQATDSGTVVVLTPTALSPAAVNSFATITFHSVTIADGFDIHWKFGPDKLVMPFRGIVWPADAGSGAVKFFTTT